MNKVYIETYGCQMNEYDTELVKTILKDNNFNFTDQPEDAQIIFLNTCSVRENAHEKVHQRLRVFRQLLIVVGDRGDVSYIFKSQFSIIRGVILDNL